MNDLPSRDISVMKSEEFIWASIADCFITSWRAAPDSLLLIRRVGADAGISLGYMRMNGWPSHLQLDLMKS